MTEPYKVDVERKVQARIKHHQAWWIRNRKGSPIKFGRALNEAYDELRASPNAGARYVSDDGFEALRIKMTTQHWLFYRVVERPPLRPYVLVIGIQGPGEAEPFILV